MAPYQVRKLEPEARTVGARLASSSFPLYSLLVVHGSPRPLRDTVRPMEGDPIFMYLGYFTIVVEGGTIVFLLNLL